MKQPVFRNYIRTSAMALQRIAGIRPRNFCLVSGPPRSGTTAVTKWLKRQPRVAAFGEKRILIGIHRFVQAVDRFRVLKNDEDDILELARGLFFSYYARAGVLIGRSLLVEKEPLEPIAFPNGDYGSFLASTKRLLPDSKFLFMIRDPVSTVWSMTERRWGSSLHSEALRKYTLEEHIENWCSCADVIIGSADDPQTYICPFGRLVSDPVRESREVFDFLEIRRGQPFQPRPTKVIGFSSQQRDVILEKTAAYVEALRDRGITNL